MRDAVARLTPLGVVLLALLDEADMHPYEMLRLLRLRRRDRLVRVTNGTLYHTVGRLERLGLIAEVGVDREGNRPERTTYTLRDAGRAALRDWVGRELARTDRPEPFRVALAEAHNLPRDDVRALLGARRDRLAADAAELAAGLERTRVRGVEAQFLVELDRAAALARAELGWLDDVLARLDAGDLPWGVAREPAASAPDARKAAFR